MQFGAHPLFLELQASLAGIVPCEPVAIVGGWTSSIRRTKEAAAQVESRSPPVVDVTDTRWSGNMTCSSPIACIAFLVTPGSLCWARSQPPAIQLSVALSVHAYADARTDCSTFASTVGGAYLPAVPIRQTGVGESDFSVETSGLQTGCMSLLARAEHAEVFVYVIPGTLLTTGRKRLWQLRRPLAATLPGSVRELLTRGRSGCMRTNG